MRWSLEQVTLAPMMKKEEKTQNIFFLKNLIARAEA
jgi:hypothetical protein